MVTLNILPKTLELTEKEYKLYRNVLIALNIEYDVHTHVVEHKLEIIADLQDIISVRTWNIIKANIPSLSISISDFVDNYPKSEFKRFRCCGPKSIKELDKILKESDYML